MTAPMGKWCTALLACAWVPHLSREQMSHLRAVVNKWDLDHNNEEVIEHFQRSQENSLMNVRFTVSTFCRRGNRLGEVLWSAQIRLALTPVCFPPYNSTVSHPKSAKSYMLTSHRTWLRRMKGKKQGYRRKRAAPGLPTVPPTLHQCWPGNGRAVSLPFDQIHSDQSI